MHIPGHIPTNLNQYQTTSPYDIGVSGTAKYLESIDRYWKVLEGFFTDYNYSDKIELSDYTPKTYGYQGFNPIIGNTLSDVFQFDIGTDAKENLKNIIALNFSPEGVVEDEWWWQGDSKYDQGAIIEDFSVTGADEIQSFLPFTDVFDRQSIARTLSAMVGAEPGGSSMIQGKEVVALDPEKLQQTEAEYYEPYEFIQRERLTDEYVQNIGDVTTGGFAGSGARRSGLSTAERMYDAGYGGLLAEIEKMQAKATEDVLETIYSWQDLLG